MAKKGKVKISKVKRNNHTTNKMKKQGTLRLQRHRTKVQKQRQPEKKEIEYSSDSDKESGEEWADMLDEDEQKYIMSRLAKQPSLLANVPEEEKPQKRAQKRKQNKEKPPRKQNNSDSGADTDSGSDLEGKYEKEMAERPTKKTKPLLPIKTKEGVLEQVEECDDTESEQEQDNSPPLKKSKKDQHSDDAEDQDSGMEGTTEEETVEGGEVVSAVQLLAARRDRLAHDKLRIGALCSSLLESPEKKLKNFYPILYLMEDRLKDGALNLHSVRKLASLSAYEVFKDILPEYQIRHQDYSNIKLKKDTLALYKFEKELLEFYKRYLQRLEKAAGMLRRKKGDTRKLDNPTRSLSLVSLQCMCGLLEARPQFNYATNIAQSVVPYLDCGDEDARKIVTDACVTVFAEDRKGDITLVIVRLINQLVKRRDSRLHPAALDCLLSLKIRDVDLSAEDDIKHKKKLEEKHKKRIVNLSKKEKKRNKKLKEVERELLETEAQESEVLRKKQLTEVTRTVFHIYFRLLKQAPTSRLLSAALKGLAKFSSVINVEYYSDLVAVLSRLLAAGAARQRLALCGAVLALLAGAGDALNVDPAQFHHHLYHNMIDVHAGKSQEDSRVVVSAVAHVAARARRVSAGVLCALAKRLLTVALQAAHHTALPALRLLHDLAQQSKPVSNLLELDTESTGSGRFDPTLESPEHCNAQAATATELTVMVRHYHPTVRETAKAVLQGNVPQELQKLSPVQIHDQYDSSKMSFKPAVPPPPRRTEASNKSKSNHTWAQPEFRAWCHALESAVDMVISG